MELREQFPTMTEVRNLEHVGFSSEQIATLFSDLLAERKAAEVQPRETVPGAGEAGER